jgi:hypothetical protein
MRRTAHALAGVLIAITATPALARKPPVPPRPTCEKTSERFAKRQAEWEAFSSQSFTDALAREDLTVPKMTRRQMSPSDAALKNVRPGTTFKLGGALAVYTHDVQGYRDPGDEFVQDAQGVIHPLVRKENLVGTETHTLCGCGPMGGGAVPPTFAIVYALPPSTTYDATPIELAYDAKHIEIRWRNVVDGKDVMCAPPP